MNEQQKNAIQEILDCCENAERTLVHFEADLTEAVNLLESADLTSEVPVFSQLRHSIERIGQLRTEDLSNRFNANDLYNMMYKVVSEFSKTI